jgi:predicted O-methyltransferase YrrM
MLRLAEKLHPQTSGRVYEQTALNGACYRLGIPVQILDRRYNWSLFGEGNLHEQAGCIVAHFNSDILRRNWQSLADQVGQWRNSPQRSPHGNRHYRYHRVGHDERAVYLRDDGTIGRGGGNAERFWFVRQTVQGEVLCIGSETELIAELKLDKGVWRGNWLNYERMPVAFMPHRAQVLADLLGHKTRELRGAEIGVLEGHTSELLLRELPNLRLYMVDRWLTPSPGERYYEDPFIREIDQGRMFGALSLALQKTRFAEYRRMVLVSDQVRAAGCVPDNSLDFVFVDSDHSAAGTLEAIDAWWPKVCPGGLMAGHDLDYPEFPGVRVAVEETSRRRDQSWHAARLCWYFRVA